MISARIMSDCLRGLAGRDESHPAGSKALPLTNPSVWWWKSQPGKLSLESSNPRSPSSPHPVWGVWGTPGDATWLHQEGKILFLPWLNGAAPPHVLWVVDAKKDCRGLLILGIPSRVNSKIPLRNLYLWLWLLPKLKTEISHWSPTQLILFQLGKRHTSCLCKCTILLKPWLCMKTSSLLPDCSVLILTSNCLISNCSMIPNPWLEFSCTHTPAKAESNDSLWVMNIKFGNISISPSFHISVAFLGLMKDL